MISRDNKTNKGLAASNNNLSSDIWKRLTIIKTEAWFDTVKAIAKQNNARAKLESRYRKSVDVYDADGIRLGHLWQLDENDPIYWSRKQWVSHFKAANMIAEAIEQLSLD
ncbi:hypothetical protein [Myxosarcina sp. GI1(2024)]